MQQPISSNIANFFIFAVVVHDFLLHFYKKSAAFTNCESVIVFRLRFYSFHTFIRNCYYAFMLDRTNNQIMAQFLKIYRHTCCFVGHQLIELLHSSCLGFMCPVILSGQSTLTPSFPRQLHRHVCTSRSIMAV